MCRFVAYLGEPVLAEDLITLPENSLIHQSYRARETSMPVNADGFGMGWYNKAVREEPGLFKSVTPAWNDPNLRAMASVVQTNCLLAHIRAATEGAVSLENTHPFRYQRFLMMQNGGVRQFARIKRLLVADLDDEYYQWIQGQTDSEYIFALYMQTVAGEHQARGRNSLPLSVLADCFRRTFERIEEYKKQRQLTEASVYNMVITDGRRLLATRYSSDPQADSRTLYLAKGRKYVCQGNRCQMLPPKERPQAILVVSEKLDRFVEEWHPVPDNHALLVEADYSYTLQPL